jgi:AraC-like DNA-binding protein/quercetin dioxygenase-like cupin family protein
MTERSPTPPQDARSTDPDAYQAVPRAVAAMAKRFPSGFEIAPHAHPRDQLLYAVSGVMRVQTETEAWIVPPDRAVYLPAGTRHKVAIRGNLEMRTLYIRPGYIRPGYIMPGTATGIVASACVLEVSDLLRALILALLREPLLYDEQGRGDLIARLILNELMTAPHLPLGVPMPTDARLRRVCDALLANPEREATLEAWAAGAGASARTLARLFQEQLNMGFAVWRQHVRFHSAVEALSAGQPVGRVARQSGYRSASAFSAAFRRMMGVSPSTIRVSR